MIVRKSRKRIIHMLVVNVKGYSHSGRLSVSYRTKPVFTIQPKNCTLGHLSWGNGNSHKDLYTKYS